MKTRHLLLTLLVIPSIPIAIWFSVLYHYHAYSIELSQTAKFCLISVGVLFVINSLDSLIRLYTTNLGVTTEVIGKRNYVLGNVGTLLTLIFLYQFTPFEIEWVGLMVIALYALIYGLLWVNRDALRGSLASTEG